MTERKSSLPAALTIAGSDPSGGAGIQADLKTFHRFGVYGEAAISLLTVQNTFKVTRVHLIPVELVLEQVAAVLEDIPPAAAKTGALGSIELITAVGRAAAGWTFPLVVDPVLLSKHGAALAPQDAADAFRQQLIPRAALLIPNLPEAAALCGFPVDSVEAMERAATALADLGAAAVLVKGGHLEGDPIDVLFWEGRFHHFPAARIATRHTHGTGCTFSAAITANLARGFDLIEAIRDAKAFVDRAIRGNPGLGSGAGPLNHWA